MFWHVWPSSVRKTLKEPKAMSADARKPVNIANVKLFYKEERTKTLCGRCTLLQVSLQTERLLVWFPVPPGGKNNFPTRVNNKWVQVVGIIINNNKTCILVSESNFQSCLSCHSFGHWMYVSAAARQTGLLSLILCFWQASEGNDLVRSEMSSSPSSVWLQLCKQRVNTRGSTVGIMLYIFLFKSWIRDIALSGGNTVHKEDIADAPTALQGATDSPRSHFISPPRLPCNHKK